MNGAESLVKTLLNNAVDVCFTNPGTSEMHFVAALDAHEKMRCVLGLQENVVTGAADGYARIIDKPAATLLHLGPGLSNGLANIHNANRARSAMINIVGDHATYHRKFDAPLTSDIEAIAHPVSHRVHTSPSADDISTDAAQAITCANTYPGQISTLILPADTAWTNTRNPVVAAKPAPGPVAASEEQISEIANIIRSGEPTLLIIGGRCLREEPLKLAGKIIAGNNNIAMKAETSNGRMERGAGRQDIDRIPYPVDQALEMVKNFKHAILIEARDPVAFFAYPGKPSRILPEDCIVHNLAGINGNGHLALEMLVEELGSGNVAPAISEFLLPPLVKGQLNADSLGSVIAHAIPENAIVIDEAITSGRQFFPATATSNPHSWLQLNGGAIGIGIPLAIGAAIGAPDRPVISLQADGSAMYTVQGLWTQARENLKITTIIFHNRSYNILKSEMRGVGIENPGPSARNMLELDNPVLDWVSIANGMGVEAGRANDCQSLLSQIQRGLASQGPYLIEAEL
ncbi:MAG: acetolactate synthase large subunit [Hyphomicrobiales bacterium]|nr:acetolactate synthase large subunit [Hyphomicrobiales bacterium]